MKNLNLRTVLLLSFVSSIGYGQSTPPTIQQKSEKSTCANIVALVGNVDLKCSSLTPAQSKALANIPTILKMALENKDYLESILNKLDEMSKTTTQPSTTTIIAPGGFATTGGYLDHPQVTNNNFRPPPPVIEVSEPVYGKPFPIYEQVSPYIRGPQPQGPPRQIGMSHPSVSITITLKGEFQNPQFVADCSVPCVLAGQSFLTPNGGSYSDGREFSGLSTQDQMTAGVAIHRQMFAGEQIKLVFQSLDDRSLTIAKVRPNQP